MNILQSLDIYPYVLLNDFLRYFIAAGISYLLFWIIFKKRWQHRMIQKRWPKWHKKWFEFRYSMSTVLIFSFIGLTIVQLKMAGYTKIYDDINKYGLPWFFVSMVFMVVGHDAYYYWVHRLMHHPKLFRHIHLVHHRSTNPSPWAAYSFHPIEAFLEAAIYVIFVFILPIHGLALMLFLISMIIRNVVSHLGMEILPKWFIRTKWLNWLTTTTHHDLHHQNFKTNFSIYFTWWDRWFGTEDKKYVDTFEEVTSRPREKQIKTKKVPSSIKTIILLLLGSPSLNCQSPAGLWQTFHEKTGEPLSVIRIQQVDDQWEGQITRLFLRPWEGTDPVCTECTGERKNQKVIGMTFLWGFNLQGQNGWILDPATGEVYSSKMWLEDENNLKVRGYTGPLNLFYRTQGWKRKSSNSSENSFIGIWETIDDQSGLPTAIVEIKKQGERLLGQVKELFQMPWEGDDPICLKCPGEKKEQKIVGMTILWGFEKSKNKWSGGKILDPSNGKTYTGAIWMEDENTLKIRGYLGPFYRTQRWKRVEGLSLNE